MRSGNVTVKVRWPSIPMEVTYVDVPPNTRLRAILPSRYPIIDWMNPFQFIFQTEAKHQLLA